MSALRRSSQLARGVFTNGLVAKPQTFAPALTRCLSEEQAKKREAWREKMQYPDDTPVYLRGGPLDYVLFGITCVLVGSGTCFSIYRVFTRAQS